MNLLRESNMQLGEENKHNFEECQKLRKHEIETLKMEKDHLPHKVSELLESCKNIDVEDSDRMKNLVRDIQAEEIGQTLSEKQDSISPLEQDLSNCILELEEREKRINDILQVEATLKLDVERQRKLMAQFKMRIDSLSREKESLSREKENLSGEKEDLGKENQKLSKQLNEIKQGVGKGQWVMPLVSRPWRKRTPGYRFWRNIWRA